MSHKKFPVLLLLIIGSLLAVVSLLAILAPPTAVAETTTPTADFPVIADFEGGAPPEWFIYNGDASSFIAEFPIFTDTQVLSVTFNVGDFAGFGANLIPAQDWSDYDAISFDFYGNNSGITYTIEAQDGSDAVVERFHGLFLDDFTGWRQILIPFSAFVRGGFQDGGAPDNGFQLTNIPTWVFPLPQGNASFRLDNIALVNLLPFADFEGGAPAGWFQYNGGGAFISVAFPTITDTDSYALPGQVGENGIVSGTYDLTAGWAGVGANFLPSQDWSDFDGVSFWFYGDNSGTTYAFEAQDGTTDNPVAERFQSTFTDNFNGWRHIALPFSTFVRSGFQDGGAPDDGFGLVDIRAWAWPLPATDGRFVLDHLSIYGNAGDVELRVQFNASSYTVDEGNAITLTVSLNAVSTDTVSVEYATVHGTATASDYIPVSGTLTFDPGETSHQIVITTIDDLEPEGNEAFTVELANPVNTTLGSRNIATVTIRDNEQSAGGKTFLIDDYELTELPYGLDGTAEIGWVTWSAPAASSAITVTQVLTSGAPEPVPGLPHSQVLQFDTHVNSGEWAGFTHAFENETADTWIPQDWSGFTGVAFWLYGNNTGGTLYLDILDNRNPDSTSDDAERWGVDIPDSFSGWQYFEFAFTDFARKEIGNGAPNDGFTLTEIHGYSFGVFGSVAAGPQTNYVENFSLLQRVTIVDDYELAELVTGVDGTADIGWITWNAPAASSAITLTQIITAGVPEPIPGLPHSQVLQLDTSVSTGEWAGFTHAFENETADTWVTQNWSTYEGVCFWLYGNNSGGTMFVDILDNRPPGATSDSAERWSHEIADNFSGWRLFTIPFSDFSRKEIGNGAPNDGFNLTEVHGYAFGVFGTISMGPRTNYVENFSLYGNTTGSTPGLTVAFAQANYSVTEGGTAVIAVSLNVTSTEDVQVDYRTAEGYATPDRDYVPVNGTLTIPAGQESATFTVATIQDAKYEGNENLMLNLSNPVNAVLGFRTQTILNIIENDPFDPALVHDFEGYQSFAVTGAATLTVDEIPAADPLAVPGQGAYEHILSGSYTGPAQLVETFVQAEDWSSYEALSFWYYGTGSGNTVTVELLENQGLTTADLPATEWELVWEDNFDGAAGSAPNPNIWQHEMGDGSLNGIPGWGNGEFQYYTDSTDNAALDGAGNLVITLQKVDTDNSDLVCWYGPCEYTSARLISRDRMEYEYGRIETSVQVPTGGSGLWPAFWMLGTNIGEVGWPQSGEIDIMEYVSRIPTEVFGTIHGPGYSGGSGYGDTYDFGHPVSLTSHIFAIEWGPDQIRWFVDGINFLNADPSDVAPHEWVYNNPFFLIYNVAIGGNFGGAISPDIAFPQTMEIDYLRVYQGVNSSERFEATFVDSFTGWRKVVLPFADFSRSDVQPDGAPNDGLTLEEVWGYGFHFASGDSGTFRLDRVYLETELPTYSLYLPLVAKQP